MLRGHCLHIFQSKSSFCKVKGVLRAIFQIYSKKSFAPVDFFLCSLLYTGIRRENHCGLCPVCQDLMSIAIINSKH